jgi:hypothetical protein
MEGTMRSLLKVLVLIILGVLALPVLLVLVIVAIVGLPLLWEQITARYTSPPDRGTTTS